jgi:uncharacterized protein YndB with AHSA1/START domain
MIRPETTDTLPEDRTIRSAREFAATPESLWKSFENPERLALWWGPSGFTNHFEEFDFRPGGAWRFTMRDPQGNAYPQNKVFISVRERDRLVVDHEDPVHGFRMFILFIAAPHGTRLEWILVFDTAGEAAKVRPFVEPANEQNFDRLQEMLSQ